jgi:hypothetical protein
VLLPVVAGSAAADGGGEEEAKPRPCQTSPLPVGAEEVKKAKKAKAKARGKAKAKVPKEASGSSGVLQPAVRARKRFRGRAPAKIQSGDDQRVLLLQLKRPHYDAIMSGRKQWEARPLCDGSNRGFTQSIFDKLATVGRVAVLQSGFGTNHRMRIIDVRRYRESSWKDPPAVRTMVVELGVDLLPDEADANARVKVYESLYGVVRCATGFVAMRFGRLSVVTT